MQENSDSKSFQTLSGIDLNNVYGQKDLEGIDSEDGLGSPGEYPFTRGAYPSMYRERLWTRRQIAGFGTAEATNQRYQFLLSRGQTGLSTDFDHPTLTGLDSDHELADGEVGRLGVAVDTLGDMHDLFQGIKLDDVSVSMTINHPAIVMLCMFLAVVRNKGLSWPALRGTVQNDSLKEFYGQKTFALPPGPALKLTTDIVEFCTRHVPNWYTVSISGYHTRESGSDAIQELAFTMAQGMAYVESALARGLPVDSFAPRLSFFFGCHNDLFEEVAKFRAARRMWARTMKERYHAQDPNSMRLRFHTQTLGSTLYRQDPQNNIVRGALQGLAAVLGGTQSLHISGYDEAYDIPSEDAMRMSLATQLILAHETGVTGTVDPMGGSPFLETLTNQIEEQAWEYIRKIDDMGGGPGVGAGSMRQGMLEAINTGYIEQEIARASYRYQRQLEEGSRSIIGVNAYQSQPGSGDNTLEVFEFDEAEEARQLERLASARSSRSKTDVAKGLQALSRGAKNDENLMPLVLSAVEAGASEGEVMDVFRDVYGEFIDPGVF